MPHQERERKLITKILYPFLSPANKMKILEVGCGAGYNLHILLGLGFMPQNLFGNDIIPDRIEQAKTFLPSNVNLLLEDAASLPFPNSYFNAVYASTVFSSILDEEVQTLVSKEMWRLIKPGGGVIFYDFIYNNPNNQDVRAVKIKKIKTLFPDGKLNTWKITLAPPISRFVTKIHPYMYNVFNIFPILRSHVLCWIQKPNDFR